MGSKTKNLQYLSSGQYAFPDKLQRKAFKKMVENLIGKTAFTHLSSSFNLENGEEQLVGVFKIVDKFVYEGQIKIEKAEPYLNAFNSIRDMYDPIPSDSEWNRAEDAVREAIEKEIDQNGFFC